MLQEQEDRRFGRYVVKHLGVEREGRRCSTTDGRDGMIRTDETNRRVWSNWTWSNSSLLLMQNQKKTERSSDSEDSLMPHVTPSITSTCVFPPSQASGPLARASGTQGAGGAQGDVAWRIEEERGLVFVPMPR